MPEIRSIVRENVVTAAPDAPVSDVATLMDEEDVGSVIVVEDDRPVGIVTDRDVAVKVVARREDPADVTAEDVMTGDVVTVPLDAGIFEVIRTMQDESVRRIPAVDEDGRLAGIVAFDDFVVLLGRELDQLGDVVEAEIPPYEHV
ncbi:CBS domain-containing protein [Halomicrobium urmianum]|uniref:CBS domain-containing protein n=1 Tax=Halomicrobium urmianum TaxID=1586233 RepID=UPI001CDA408A|nr:CBS domain-containing protein [Halomicrobium urmianum]